MHTKPCAHTHKANKPAVRRNSTTLLAPNFFFLFVSFVLQVLPEYKDSERPSKAGCVLVAYLLLELTPWSGNGDLKLILHSVVH